MLSRLNAPRWICWEYKLCNKGGRVVATLPDPIIDMSGCLFFATRNHLRGCAQSTEQISKHNDTHNGRCGTSKCS